MAANDRVGDVYLDVKPRGDGFNSGVQAIINKAERDAAFAVKANTGPAQQAVDQLANDITQKIGGGWQEATVKAAAFTAAIFGARAAVEGVINKFSELFDGLRKAQAGFNSILGDREGSALLQEVRQFAIDSPFVTGELVSYSQQLLGVGKAANTIVPTLKNVGDIVASVGGDTSNLGSILYALTQIQTIGKLTGQDARQLQNQLVPITRYIAEYTKQSVEDVKKLQEAGGISSDIVFAAIQQQGAKVEGALNDSVRTIAGAKSVLKDTIQNIFQSNEGLSAINDQLVAGIQRVAAAIGDPKTLKFINDTIDSAVRVYNDLQPAIEGFLAFGSSAGLSGLKSFTSILTGLSNVLEAIPESALRLLGTALGVLATLKAPLALIQYAKNIGQISSGLLGGGGLVNGLSRANIALASTAPAAAIATSATQKFTNAEFSSALAAQKANAAYSALPATFIIVAEQAALATAALDRVGTKASLAQRALGAANKGIATLGGVGGALKDNARLIGSVAAGVAGSAITSNTAEDNQFGQAAGNALTYGAIGFQVAGPYGAAVGAAFGAVTGYLDATDARLEKQIERNRELGKAAAEAYLKENEKLFLSYTPASSNKLQTDLDKLKKETETLQRDRDAIKKANEAGNPVSGFLDKITGADNDTENAVGDFDKQLAALEPRLKVTRDAYNQYVQPILDTVYTLDQQGLGTAFFDPAAVEGTFSKVIKNFEDLDAAINAYGATTADVVNDKAGFIALVTQIETLNSAQQKATISANLMNKALLDAKGATGAIYDGQIAVIQNDIKTITSLEAAKKATIDALTPGKTAGQQAIANLTVDDTTLKAQADARTTAAALADIEVERQITEAKKAGNKELADSLELKKVDITTKAGQAAADAVLIDLLRTETQAIIDQNISIEHQNKLRTDALRLSDLQGKAGALSATKGAESAAIAAALNPADEATRYAAGIALESGKVAVGAQAASEATADLVARRQELITQGGFEIDEPIIKLYDSLIRTTGEAAATAAELQLVADVAEKASKAGIHFNEEAVTFLKNLREGAELANQILGAEREAQSAEVSRIAAVAQGASAIAALINDTDGSDIAERAAVESAALAARDAQIAHVYANLVEGLGDVEAATQAAAVGQETYDRILATSNLNIETVVGSLTGLNSKLDSVDGRNAIISITLSGIAAAMQQIAELDIMIAQLTGSRLTESKGGYDVQPTSDAELADLIASGAYNAQANQAADAQAANLTKWQANEQLKLDILSGKAADTIGYMDELAKAAQAVIQPKLDAADEAAAKKSASAGAKGANEAEAEAKRFLKAVEQSTEALTDKLEASAKAIADAANKWVVSIKERTQYEDAVSTSRLTRNVQSQNKDLTEITAGISNLKSRGITQSMLDTLGIDSIADTKQVRKLVNSSGSDLAKLASELATRSSLSETLATSEQQAAERKNISLAIQDAAKNLGFDGTTKADADALAAQFNFTSTMDSAAIANQILNILSGGKIG